MKFAFADVIMMMTKLWEAFITYASKLKIWSGHITILLNCAKASSVRRCPSMNDVNSKLARTGRKQFLFLPFGSLLVKNKDSLLNILPMLTVNMTFKYFVHAKHILMSIHEWANLLLTYFNTVYGSSMGSASQTKTELKSKLPTLFLKK